MIERWPLIAATMVTLLSGVALARWTTALVRHRARGLDASDESYYLLWAVDPDAPIARQGDFGYYLNLMWRWSGGSLASLRLAGAVAILAACALMAAAVTRWIPAQFARRVRRLAFVANWVCVSAVAFTYYALWLVTPSYNLLSLVFGLVAFAGLIGGLAGEATRDRRPARSSTPTAWFVVLGAAGALLADVKPMAGAAAATLCLPTIVAVSGLRRSVTLMKPTAAGIAIGIAVNVVVVGSPATTYTEARRFVHMVAIGRYYSAEQVWDRTLVIHSVLPWLASLAVTSVAVAAVWRWVRSPTTRTLVIGVTTAVVSVLLWGDRPHGGPAVFSGDAGWWWLRMTGWTLVFVSALAERRERVLMIGPFVALGGLAASVGTDNGFIRLAGLMAGLFAAGVLVQAVLVASRGGGELLRALPAFGFFLCAAVVSASQVAEALRDPYRLEASVAANRVPVRLRGLGTVEVSPGLARYVIDLQRIGPRVPAAARNCLVDLAGGTPLSALALEARPATTPWTFGGYAGTGPALEYIIGYAPCVSGPVLLIEAVGGERAIARSSVLEGRRATVVGEVRFDGYIDEVQVVSVVEPTSTFRPTTPGSG